TSVLFYSLGWTDTFGKIAVLTIGTVVCVAASMAGDISQDLKTGYIIGATPARQQTAELTAVVVNTWVIAGVVLLLGNQYGFGGEDFPAPQATLMKTVIDGVLSANLPWGLVLTGAAFAVVAELLGIPSLAFAVGIYLPLSTMTAVFAGGCLRALIEKLSKDPEEEAESDASEKKKTARGTERGVLFSSGLIAGEGLMGIGTAAVVVAVGGQRPPGIGFEFPGHIGQIVSLAAFIVLGYLLFRTARAKDREPAADG
ncbi:MAG: oligopeptide transporter, OPT family, partial [bacterium]|nr:oligopeptide transporter, OPT family [bacterium]